MERFFAVLAVHAGAGVVEQVEFEIEAFGFQADVGVNGRLR